MKKIVGPGLVGTQASICHEQYVVVDLLRVPLPAFALRLLRVLTGGREELRVLFGAEPRAVNDLSRSLIGGREIRNVRKPALPDGSLQDKPQGDELIMKRATCWGFVGRCGRIDRGGFLAGFLSGDPENPVLLPLSGV